MNSFDEKLCCFLLFLNTKLKTEDRKHTICGHLHKKALVPATLSMK